MDNTCKDSFLAKNNQFKEVSGPTVTDWKQLSSYSITVLQYYSITVLQYYSSYNQE